ncbi:MAG: hypothetical protein GXX79_14085, partial [Actinomycetales bacterium]|nr:hypothetical protein [Actinomycetales bacterium]
MLRPTDLPVRRLNTMYLADGRVIVTRRPRRTLMPLAVLDAMTGRLRPEPGILRFDCGTTYRISEWIDWRQPDGAVELVLIRHGEPADLDAPPGDERPFVTTGTVPALGAGVPSQHSRGGRRSVADGLAGRE